ncbi:MAG: XRE family transcriptional regulator [Bryobacterales bacterium]|nr:XRE family transcriptional regulator [Bryobacterales bacterium]
MKTKFEIEMEDPEFRRLFAQEQLAGEASELVWKVMQERGLSKADLARLLGKSRAWVSQMLGTESNLTLRTLADVMHRLGTEVHLRAEAHATAKKAPETRPVVYKVNGQLTAPPSKTRFRIETKQVEGDAEGTGEEPGERPEYAA